MKPLYAVFGGVAIAAVTAAGTVAYMRSGQQPTREQAAAPAEAAASVATVKPRADQILRLVCRGIEQQTVNYLPDEGKPAQKSVAVDFQKRTLIYDGLEPAILLEKEGSIYALGGDEGKSKAYEVTIDRLTGAIKTSFVQATKSADGRNFSHVDKRDFSGECQEVKGPKF